MEDIVNLIDIFTNRNMYNLACVVKLLYHMREKGVICASLLNCDYSGSFLPDVIVFPERPRVLVLSDQLFLLFRPQIHHHLLWLRHCSPQGWIEIGLYEVIRELEDLLVTLLLAVSEVLTELLDSIRDTVKSPPSLMISQLELMELSTLIDMLAQ